ncbi:MULTISPECIES: iron uptake transporter deferrochelatase/peroxidase subunit [unclassified Streptomyces]|uniref:iron uptake transporter deferrochelatase/peroxidase subunit n=1 Tax=unclassified Streptomyces TaxID=2593676 RepID=UPI000748F152|nr:MULTISPECIES: iron uptake transporter deferrochelatase/peroxidase subunit [unclassified Streptomyces]KUL67951.1 peroxidase [Streptomyces sp. NRRL WC-3605]KUL77424.1 peroxidase [Streptomyces sp. NRRL WC-3604]
MTEPSEKTTSRRALLGWGGAGLALGAVAAGGAVAATRAGDDAEPAGAGTGAAIPFHGERQAGVATPVQDRLHFAAFDVRTEDRDAFVEMLKEWTEAARRMTAGHAVGDGAYGGLAEAPPDDTGEALGLKPSRLTLTIGFGPSFFDKFGERFGIADARPEALTELPQFAGDNLDRGRSGGDLCVQACADDPQVAVHAIRNLARIGFGKVVVRWSQLGFGKTSSTTPDAQTPRNLFGFKDGTRNIAGTETDRLDEFVWVGEKDGPQWMAGGSYLVARRIRMHIETWDRTSLQEQEDIFGRSKGEGAPVGRAKERDKPFLKAMMPDAHVRLAHPDSNGGATILRRGYSFTDGTDGLGRLDAGLFFLAYQRDPRTGFIRIQRNLAKDALNEYIQHVGSALFAVPPGVRDKDDWWGSTLFGKEA